MIDYTDIINMKDVTGVLYSGRVTQTWLEIPVGTFFKFIHCGNGVVETIVRCKVSDEMWVEYKLMFGVWFKYAGGYNLSYYHNTYAYNSGYYV